MPSWSDRIADEPVTGTWLETSMGIEIQVVQSGRPCDGGDFGVVPSEPYRYWYELAARTRCGMHDAIMWEDGSRIRVREQDRKARETAHKSCSIRPSKQVQDPTTAQSTILNMLPKQADKERTETMVSNNNLQEPENKNFFLFLLEKKENKSHWWNRPNGRRYKKKKQKVLSFRHYRVQDEQRPELRASKLSS